MPQVAEQPDAVQHRACIALVDDDPVFLRLFADNLQAAGYHTECFDDPKQALAVLQRDVLPDAWILDWNMPGLSGLELFKLLRARNTALPVLFLTSFGQPMFEEAALEAGAVDFVDKTRSPAIILHRLSLALTRRAAPADMDQSEISIGSLQLSHSSKRASWRGRNVSLSRNEYDVVALLAEHAGRDVSYRQIYDMVRGDGFLAGQGEDGYRANVRAMVKRIRQKFLRLDADFAALHNYPGFGYRWHRDG